MTAYIIDTGIRTTHTDFGGRAPPGFDAVDGGTAPTTATGTARTSPAPSAARRTAWPRASRWSPSACSTAAAAAPTPASSPASTGSPTNAGRARGGQHEPRRRRGTALDDAVAQLDRRRRHLRPSPPATSSANACNSSPARAAEAITVGATDQHRRPRVVLQLRHVPGHLRARRRHHLGLEHAATPRPTRSAARRWPPRTWPAPPRSTSSSTRARRRQRCARPGREGDVGRHLRHQRIARPAAERGVPSTHRVRRASSSSTSVIRPAGGVELGLELSRYSTEMRDMTVFHELLNKKNRRSRSSSASRSPADSCKETRPRWRRCSKSTRSRSGRDPGAEFRSKKTPL